MEPSLTFSAMVRAMRARGATPVFFLDEPSLYLLDRRRNPTHALLFEVVRLAWAKLDAGTEEHYRRVDRRLANLTAGCSAAAFVR